MPVRFGAALCAGLLVAWIVAGCGGERQGTGERGTETRGEAQVQGETTRGAGAAQVSTEVEAILVRADQVDGSADKVIAHCAGCALRMAGTKDHALQVGQYEMHFCSEGCKGKFTEDTQKAILALTIPDAGGE